MLNKSIFKKKKAMEMGSIVVMLAVVAIFAVLILLVSTGKFGKSVNIASSTQSSSAVKLCSATWNRNNPDTNFDEYDLDEDGIVDPCDTCTLKIKENEFKSQTFEEMEEWFKQRDITVDVTYELYKDLFKNIPSNDRDGDGIYDGCDSNVEKSVTIWFGKEDLAIKSECEKVAKKFPMFHYKTSNYGKYTTCIITS